MNIFLFATGVLIAGLLGLLAWSVGRKSLPGKSPLGPKETLSFACKHLTNLPQIRQAMEPQDLSYIANRSSKGTARTVRQERRRVTSHYLKSLREDFDQLMEAAQVVASLSPKVEARQEWRRFRLNLEFKGKYQLVRWKFAVGLPAFTALSNLTLLVSSLALDIERAVAEIGESAAFTSNLGSSTNR